jgi:hypothetical protein
VQSALELGTKAILQWATPPIACAVAAVLQAQIKQLLTGLMLSTPQLIRAQLSEALTIISSHDFPANWPQLLPELVERLNGAALQQQQQQQQGSHSGIGGSRHCRERHGLQWQ